jgi:hypothetical protein
VLLLLTILVIVFIILAIVLAATTLGVQGYIYSEPVPGISWRAPAAGGAIALFLALWAFLDYGSIKPEQTDVPYDTLFRFAPTETRELDKFWSIKSSSFEAPPEQDKKILYSRRVASAPEYVDPQGRRWERSDAGGVMRAIVVEEPGGQEIRLEPDKTVEKKNPSDPDGPKIKYFDSERNKEAFPGYKQVNGRRKMLQIGVLSVFRWGLFLANLLLNAIFFGVCFVCVWLILRFQWTHALMLGGLLWLVLSLVVMPILLAKTQELARRPPTTPPPSASLHGPGPAFRCWPGCA